MSNSNYELFQLPQGWEWTEICEIAYVTKLAGFEYTKYFNYQESGLIRVVRGLNLGYGAFKAKDFKYIEKSISDALPRSQLKGGELLIAYVGTLGSMAILPKDGNQYHLGPNVGKVVFNESVAISKFFLFFLLSSWGQRQIHKTSKAVAQSSLSMEQIRGFVAPIAPLAEQQRIVEEIEKQFTRLDVAVAALKRVQANLKRYRASVLKAACEGKLVPTEAELARAQGRDYESADKLLDRILKERRAKWEADQLAKMKAQGKEPKDGKWKEKYQETAAPDVNELPELPKGWKWTTVEQLAAFEINSITDGPFGSNLKTEHYKAVGPRVIRLQNIGNGIFNDEYAHITQEHYERLSKHQVKAGDIVIAALGEKLPRVCIVPAFVGDAIVKADCIRYKPNSDITSANYLKIALNSEPVRTLTASKVHGVGRPRLNLGEVKSVELPLPPLAEQQRIVAEVERRLSVVDEIESVIKVNLKRAERQRQAILKHAFEGKLVPQDPNDEPASVLLERIRAEQASLAAATKPAKPARTKRTAQKSKQIPLALTNKVPGSEGD